MSLPGPDELTFKYTAVDRTGKQVRDVVRARDARSAARALVAEGLTPITVQETRAAAAVGGGKNRDLTFSEKVSVLRQLALMVEAGVSLLEALQTVTQGIVAIKGRQKMEAVITALKRGEAFGPALETHAPGYPFYVYAMSRVGEATGKLAEVLAEAAEQMAFEDKLRRDFTGSLVYPAVLMFVGISVVFFLLVKVLPSFKTMIDESVPLPFPSNVMFALSDTMTGNPILVLGVLAAPVAGLIAALASRQVRESIYANARGMFLIGTILKAREITSWSRLLGFALSAGVNLLEAAALARQGAPGGPFRQGLEQFERDLKSGVDVADSAERHTPLGAMDLSLLRAGQKSGALPRMFLYIAESYDGVLRMRLKQLTALIEPITIGLIAIMVALVAVSIALAMVTTYKYIDQ